MDRVERIRLTEIAMEDPGLCPSSTAVLSRLRERGYQVRHEHGFNRTFLTPYLIRWIKTSNEQRFLVALSKNEFGSGIDIIKTTVEKRLRKIVDGEIAKRPSLCPTDMGIVNYLHETYGVRISAPTIATYIETADMQLTWIAGCEPRALLWNMKNSKINSKRDSRRIGRAIRRRFTEVVGDLLQEKPDIFPSGYNVASSIKEKHDIDFNETAVQNTTDLKKFQRRWIKECDGTAFLQELKNGRFSRVDPSIKKLVTERLRTMVSDALKENPDVFPAAPKIADILEGKYGLRISCGTLTTQLDISKLQSNWLDSCKSSVFLKYFKGKVLTGVEDDGVRKKAHDKLERIILRVVEAHKKEYPTAPAIVGWITERHGITIQASAIMRWVDLASLQLEWIRKCGDWEILNTITDHKFSSRTDARVLEAREKRGYDAIVNLANQWRRISATTLRRYMNNYPELAFLRRAVSEHVITVDQSIALAMQVWRASRSDVLHNLIGNRLEQLWGFREIVTLAKASVCTDTAVVSMFHETLPERVAALVPGISLTHHFVDDIFSGKFPGEPRKQILLLSFAHWLTTSQSAEMLVRLNRSSDETTRILITSSLGYPYTSDVLTVLDSFGFEATTAGHLTLTPEKGKQCGKLVTESAVIELRKVRDVEAVPETAKLFSSDPKIPAGRERIEPKSDVVSYDLEMLRTAVPMVAMWKPDATITDDRVVLRKIEVSRDSQGNDIALLELRGKVLVGFNMHPRKPHLVEVESAQIPRRLDQALSNMMIGNEGGISVSRDMRERYREFLRIVAGDRKITKRETNPIRRV
ncbi:MAG: hypothetical protein ABH842_01380 [Candidatus Micrarchaeota archaeon]